MSEAAEVRRLRRELREDLNQIEYQNDIDDFIKKYNYVLNKAKKHSWLDEVREELLSIKMMRALNFWSLLITPSICSDLRKVLEMFRDKTYKIDEEPSNYLQLMAAVLEDARMIESRNYLANNVEITKEGLEMLEVELSPLFKEIERRNDADPWD